MHDWALRALEWSPPADWRRLLVIDAHTAGEPLRVILSGFPSPEGDTILARRRDARERHDSVRRGLMWEPRGHADMYGCLIVPPVTSNADFGVLFTHNEGYSTMCGHGIIAVVTVAVELGLVPPSEGETRVGIDTPAGFIEARALVAGGRVEAVSFVNVPSFVTATDQVIDVPDVGRVNYDLAFGGAFYAFVEAGQVGLGLGPADYRRLIEVGRSIKSAIQSEGEPTHPVDPDLGLLYGTIFVGPPSDPRNHSRNVCVFADGEVDRSPTGTGVSARLALHHARGDLKAEEIVVESILGTTFRGRIAEETTVGGFTAVIPEVTGSAYITGRNEVFLDPDDPLVEGFFLR